MKALKITLIAMAIIMVIGCINITVRVTFPEEKFRAAADKIVENVQHGSQGDQTTQPQQDNQPKPDNAAPAKPQANAFRSFSLISAAYAASGDIDITVQNAEIEAIQARMEKNYDEYKPFKDNGSVGENLSGYLEERKDGSAALSADDQKKLRKIIQRENADRKDLYMALLEANGYDASQLSKIEEIFAKSWYSKSASGWYVRYNDPDKGLVWLTKADWDEKQG